MHVPVLTGLNWHQGCKTLGHKDMLMPQQRAHLHPVREGVETDDVRGETERNWSDTTPITITHIR